MSQAELVLWSRTLLKRPSERGSTLPAARSWGPVAMASVLEGRTLYGKGYRPALWFWMSSTPWCILVWTMEGLCLWDIPILTCALGVVRREIGVNLLYGMEKQSVLQITPGCLPLLACALPSFLAMWVEEDNPCPKHHHCNKRLSVALRAPLRTGPRKLKRSLHQL